MQENGRVFRSHPAVFTLVCTSGFITFISLEDKFKKANYKLVGLFKDVLVCKDCFFYTKKLNIDEVLKAILNK